MVKSVQTYLRILYILFFYFLQVPIDTTVCALYRTAKLTSL